jgi:hypothetical protein
MLNKTDSVKILGLISSLSCPCRLDPFPTLAVSLPFDFVMFVTSISLALLGFLGQTNLARAADAPAGFHTVSNNALFLVFHASPHSHKLHPQISFINNCTRALAPTIWLGQYGTAGDANVYVPALGPGATGEHTFVTGATPTTGSVAVSPEAQDEGAQSFMCEWPRISLGPRCRER